MKETSPYETHIWLYDWQLSELNIQDSPMYISLLQSVGAQTVIELGCGTGRLTYDLAVCGFDVIGVDDSAQMLDIAKTKLENFNNVILYNSKMEEFSHQTEVDAVIIPFSTFLCLPNQHAQLKTLIMISKNLKVGGLCIIDIFEPDIETTLSRLKWRDCFRRSHPLYGEVVKRERIELNVRQGNFIVVSEYLINQKVHSDRLKLRLLSGAEIRNLMSKYFKIITDWGDYSFSPIGHKNIILGIKL